MDPHLLNAYNQEVLYLRELMAEFAIGHPKISRRLGMHAGEVGDPYVERLIQSSGFLSARMQLRLAAEFPEITYPLLEAIYPNYLLPTPSMAVARLFPDEAQGDARGGFVLARGASLTSRIADGEKSQCTFVTSQDVTIYPLEIVGAQLTGIPPDIPSPNRWVPAHSQVRGALRLRLRTTNGCRMSELRGLDRLPVCLVGEESLASHLFELLHVSGLATITAMPSRFGAADAPFHVVNRAALVHEALEPGQGLLPLNWPKFHGHNLLHEYFTSPARFYFFTLNGLHKGLAAVDGPEAEIVLLLDREPGALANRVDAASFALFCTPVINLFPLRIDALELHQSGDEVRLCPVPLRPADYEVFSIERLCGHAEADSRKLEFLARQGALNQDEGGHGRYYSVRREQRASSGGSRRYGTRTSYACTDLYVSLVDQDGLPYPQPINYVSADVWVTNGDLPNLLVRNGRDDLEAVPSAPVRKGVGLVRPPTAPRAPYAHGEVAWKLIRQLNAGIQALVSDHDGRAAENLRDTLKLFLAPDDRVHRAQIDAITDVAAVPVTKKLPDGGDLVFGSGVEIRVTVDERGFAGISPYLFGLVVERYLARYVSMHSFVQTELHSQQRGLIARWPARMGTRSVT
ncbi:type VI secretion system baseplate subunit TssF [Caballeronia ptereochthonis]|uniref:type VI secretion system baseplate subunit TssF n=1 Tax=Caballeronia ptereochthonis TaxID=1777144 RepID=UPI000B34DE83|nr:type VI secretion system baseplate subunit TssF [Caballeronia ptereochthonis]